jgi:hypothetical protein
MSDGAIGSYFQRVGPSSYQPTEHTGGGWDPEELHFSPLGGLLCHAIERHRGETESPMVLGRISFDILGRLAADVCEIEIETVRPGRTIELVEATLTIRGRAVIHARAWYLASYETGAVAGGMPPAGPVPSDCDPWDMTALWPGGYIASLEVRSAAGATPGRRTVWVRSTVALVAEEQTSSLAGYIALIDTANGIAVRETPSVWMFPNVDLTALFYRQPTGQWVGLDTTVIFGPTGQGVTDSILRDEHGAIGQAQQLLTVRSLQPKPEA